MPTQRDYQRSCQTYVCHCSRNVERAQDVSGDQEKDATPSGSPERPAGQSVLIIGNASFHRTRCGSTTRSLGIFLKEGGSSFLVGGLGRCRYRDLTAHDFAYVFGDRLASVAVLLEGNAEKFVIGVQFLVPLVCTSDSCMVEVFLKGDVLVEALGSGRKRSARSNGDLSTS